MVKTNQSAGKKGANTNQTHNKSITKQKTNHTRMHRAAARLPGVRNRCHLQKYRNKINQNKTTERGETEHRLVISPYPLSPPESKLTRTQTYAQRLGGDKQGFQGLASCQITQNCMYSLVSIWTNSRITFTIFCRDSTRSRISAILRPKGINKGTCRLRDRQIS